MSIKDADSDHHYGYGKIENLSALVETLLLFGTCFWICWEAIHRLISGNTDVKISVFSYIVVITSISIDVWRSRKLMRAAKKFNSQALEADALHFSTDIWSSTVVLLGLICVTIGKYTSIHWLYYMDSIAALFVALIVIHVSYKLGKRAIDSLLDKVPEDVSEKIQNVIKNFPKIKCFHDFKIRQSGHSYYIDVTIHVDCEYLNEAHEIAEDLKDLIRKTQPESHTMVHYEPDGHHHRFIKKK